MTSRALSLASAERVVVMVAVGLGLGYAALAATSPRAAVYVLAGAVAVIVVMRSLIVGLAAFAVLTFPEQLPGVLGVGPTLAKPLGVLIVISWLGVILSDREQKVPFLPRDAPILTLALLSLLVWSLASATWASSGAVALHAASRLAQLVMLVFVTYSAVRRTRDLLLLVSAFLLGAVVTCFYVLANGTLRAGRLTGGIFDPNTLAAQLAVAIVLGTFLFVSTRRPLLRLLLVAMIVLFAAVFVQTESRSGLLALVAAALAAIVLGGPLRGRLTAVVLVVGALGLAYYTYVAPPELRARIATIGSGPSEASPLRADTWQIALRATRAHPVGGVGLGNFPEIESRYLATNLDVADVKSLRRFQLVVHNSYLEILAELGIVGFIVFLSVLGMTIGRAIMHVLRLAADAPGSILARAIAASCVGLLTAQIFVSGEYSKQFWLLLAIAVASTTISSRSRLADDTHRRISIHSLPAAPAS